MLSFESNLIALPEVYIDEKYKLEAKLIERQQQIEELELSFTDLLGIEHFVGHGTARKLLAQVRDGGLTKEGFFKTVPGGLNNSIETYLEKYRGGMVEEEEEEGTGFISPENELLDYITVRKEQEESTLTASVDQSITPTTDPVDWEYLYLTKSTSSEYQFNKSDSNKILSFLHSQDKKISSILL